MIRAIILATGFALGYGAGSYYLGLIPHDPPRQFKGGSCKGYEYAGVCA